MPGIQMLSDSKHSRALRRQVRAMKTPHLVFAAVDVVGLADALRQALFPAVSASPGVIFIDGSFLGCISHGEATPEILICLHEILNRPDVPEQVFRHILIHELIHLVVAHREIDGKVAVHPPEFWQLERDPSPERDWVWEWHPEGVSVQPGMEKGLVSITPFGRGFSRHRGLSIR